MHRRSVILSPCFLCFPQASRIEQMKVPHRVLHLLLHWIDRQPTPAIEQLFLEVSGDGSGTWFYQNGLGEKSGNAKIDIVRFDAMAESIIDFNADEEDPLEPPRRIMISDPRQDSRIAYISPTVVGEKFMENLSRFFQSAEFGQADLTTSLFQSGIVVKFAYLHDLMTDGKFLRRP